MQTKTMAEVFNAIANERAYQDQKWGAEKPQSLPGFLIVAQKELDEAFEGWNKNLHGKHAPLNELVQVAAVIVACLERYGTVGSALSTDDVPYPTAGINVDEQTLASAFDDLGENE